ncbi:hypothetical protein FZC66_16850 [Priestia megaterium]|nr:hypothetical protein FZC66_16850 [Priestia megaterium]
MSRIKSLVAGVILGGAAAAITTLVVTPYSGKELKDRIKHEKDHLLHIQKDFAKKITCLKEQLQMTAQEGNTIVKNISKDLSKTASQFTEDIRPHQQSIQSHLQEIEHSLSHLEEHVQTTKKQRK